MSRLQLSVYVCRTVGVMAFDPLLSSTPKRRDPQHCGCAHWARSLDIGARQGDVIGPWALCRAQDAGKNKRHPHSMNRYRERSRLRRERWMDGKKEGEMGRKVFACVCVCVCAQQKSPDSSVSRALSVTHPSSWLIGSLPSLSLLLSPSLSLTLSLYLPPTILLSFPRLPSLSPSIRRCS